MVFRIGVHRHMAFVQMGHHRLAAAVFHHALLGDEEGDAGPLGLIVLLGDVEHRGADHLGETGQDLGETVRVILFVDILDIILLRPGCFGITDVVDIKAQGLGQVVEPIQFHFSAHDAPPKKKMYHSVLRYILSNRPTDRRLGWKAPGPPF